MAYSEYKSEFGSTKYTPYLALRGELWGAFCEDFGENWPIYNNTALYMTLGQGKSKSDLCSTWVLFTRASSYKPYSPEGCFHLKMCVCKSTFHNPSIQFPYKTRSVSCLLMPWSLTSPDHQQPWYWPCEIRWPCLPWDWFSALPTHDISLSRKDERYAQWLKFLKKICFIAIADCTNDEDAEDIAWTQDEAAACGDEISCRQTSATNGTRK